MPSVKKRAKYLELSERIKSDIAAGVYSVGEKLPSCRVFAKERNISYLTVISAMRELEEQGLVRKERGSGVYVTDPGRARSNTRGLGERESVGALMPLSGDLFQNFGDAFVAALDVGGYDLVPLPTKEVFKRGSTMEKERAVAKFAERGFQAFVVEGTRHIPYRSLLKYESCLGALNFVIHYDSELEFPDANSVVCDFEKIGELAAAHLLELGCRGIAMLTFEPLSEMEMRLNAAKRKTHEFAILDGMESVFKESGVELAGNLDVIVDESSAENGFEITKNKISHAVRNGFDGFFCLGDHRARAVYEAAAEAGMSVGGDIKVLGMYNTKWAEVFSPKLPSISVNEREIAKIAAELIIAGKNGEKVVVEPRLTRRR